MQKSKLQLKSQKIIIVGLGNPGKEYENNRHNIGYIIVDNISENQNAKIKMQNNNVKFKIFKPNTFMNNSGEAVKKEAGYYKIEPKDIFIIHDDLDLDFGTVRVSFGSSSAGHNGVQSVIDELGTNNFWRIRIGIGRPPENIPAEKFVLQDFTKPESELLPEIIDQTATIVIKLIPNPEEKTIHSKI